MKPNRLILGDGLLGSEIVKQTGWDYASRKKDGIDFTDYSTYEYLLEDYSEIVNCIGYTNTYDTNKNKHWEVNYDGVSNLVHLCNFRNRKLIHISTDYIYSNSKPNANENDVPVHCNNWYGYTKLLGDAHVQLKSKNYLLIRCSHKPEPFPYEKAYVNLIGNFDYVSVISEKIIQLIDSDSNGVYNVGTEIKSMYDLAKSTNKNVEPTNLLFNSSMPNDVSMNLDKLNKVINEG